jgi:hypothetical protein
MTPPVEDRLLDITEAAEILKTTKDYLYRHWRELPFAFEFSPRQIRFSLKLKSGGCQVSRVGIRPKNT